jgi:hypothetical protein
MQFPSNQSCCSSNPSVTGWGYGGCGNQYPIVPGTNPALQTWNGQNFVVADGSEQNRISLPFLQVNSGAATYVVGADNNGVWSYYSPNLSPNLSGGSAGTVPYQTSVNTTGFTAVGTSGQVLLSNGTSAPTWSTNIAGQAGSVANGSVTPAKLSTGGLNWDTSGNVGIGTSSPQGSLHVAGLLPTSPTGLGVLAGVNPSGAYGVVQLNGLSTGGSVIDFSESGQDFKGRVLYDNTSNSLSISTNATEKVRIDSSGNVGIGTTSPTQKLDVVGTGGGAIISVRSSDANSSRVTIGNSAQTWSITNYGTQFVPNNSLNIADDVLGLIRFRILSDGTIDANGNPIVNCPTTAKAWGGASSAGAIDAQTFNVSTITRSALGNYLVTTAQPIVGHQIVATPKSASGFQATAAAASTTQFRIYTFGGGGAAADTAFQFVVFGD